MIDVQWDALGILVDYDPKQLSVSLQELTPAWWHVSHSRLLNFGVSPSREIIKEFLLDYVDHILELRYQTHEIGSMSNLEQLELVYNMGVRGFFVYGKVWEPGMHVMRDLLAEYLKNSEDLWLKDSVDPRYADAEGTAKYDYEPGQVPMCQLGVDHDGHGGL